MSHRVVPWAVAVLALLLLSAGLTDAQRGKTGEKKTATKKAETFAVVKVGDTYEVVAKADLKSFKKRVSDRHREELKAYAAAKKAAAKSKEPFTEKKPKAPKVSVVKKGIKSESEAREVAQRLAEKQKKGAAPRAKADPWVVADVDGNLKVMKRSELLGAKKKADSAFRDAMKAWNAGKKNAAKKKTAFEEPRPAKSIIKSVGGAFKSEEAARTQCDKLRAKKEATKATGRKGGATK